MVESAFWVLLSETRSKSLANRPAPGNNTRPGNRPGFNGNGTPGNRLPDQNGNVRPGNRLPGTPGNNGIGNRLPDNGNPAVRPGAGNRLPDQNGNVRPGNRLPGTPGNNGAGNTVPGNVNPAVRPDVGTRLPEAGRSREANNVLTDRSGNVYQRNGNGTFQQRDRSGWKPADNSSSPALPQIQRDQQMRDRSQMRTNNFDRGRTGGFTNRPAAPAARPQQMPQNRQPMQRSAPAMQQGSRQPAGRPSGGGGGSSRRRER